MKNKYPYGFLLLFILWSSSHPAVAADREAAGIPRESRVPGRELSVYRIEPWVDGPLLAAASAGAAIPLHYETKLIHAHCPCNPPTNFLDRGTVGKSNKGVAMVSHLTVGLAIAVPMVIDTADVGFNKSLTEDFVVYAEVLAINSAVSNVARYTVQRPRPDVFRPGANPSDPGEFLSFYSGHVASTFAALSAASMTHQYRYGPSWWPWAVTFGVGASEAAERIIAGRHFPTDDLVGALMGTAVGIAVPMMHHRKSADTITLSPETGGAQLVWRRKF